MKKNTFNSIKKKNLSTICHFLQYFILQSYSTHSPEFTGLNWENKFLFILSFLFCWIRNNNSESRSGSRQKFRIHADPDPQHWLQSSSVLLNERFLQRTSAACSSGSSRPAAGIDLTCTASSALGKLATPPPSQPAISRHACTGSSGISSSHVFFYLNIYREKNSYTSRNRFIAFVICHHF